MMRTQSQKIKLLFWIWPFGAFLVAMRNIRLKSYHPIILMFSFIFGYSVYLYSGDITRYAESFQVISRATWSDFFYLLKQSYTGMDYGVGHFGVVSTQPDIYALTLQFLMSRITEDFRWFFAVVSLIYTYLFLVFLDELLPEIKWVNSFWQNICFVYLLVVVPFYYPIGGVRFWTALCIFMIFTLRYAKSSRRIHIIWAASSILFHYSFITPVALLFVFQAIRWSKMLVLALVLVAMIIFAMTSSKQAANYIGSSSAFLEDDGVLKNRMEGYTSSEYIAKRSEMISSANWYARWDREAITYFLIISFLLEFAGILKFRENEFLHKIYPLYLLFFLLTLFTINLGEISRFNYLFRLLSLSRYTLLFSVNPRNKSLIILASFLFPVLILHLLVTARAGFYLVDPLLPISPSFVLFFTQSEISLSELLVGH